MHIFNFCFQLSICIYLEQNKHKWQYIFVCFSKFIAFFGFRQTCDKVCVSISKLYYTISGGGLKMYLRNIHYCINQLTFCLSETEILTYRKGQKAENHSIAKKKPRARGPFLLSHKDLNAVYVFTLNQELSKIPVAGSKENIPRRQH